MWRVLSVVGLALSVMASKYGVQICDCSTLGCMLECRTLDPNAFCGQAVSSGAAFGDKSGCSCDWGLIYNKTGTPRCIPGAAPTPAPSPLCKTYHVQGGDTCKSIAANFSTTMDHISLGQGDTCEAETDLQPGEIVIVCPEVLPTGCTYYRVVNGDTCHTIARNHNVTTDEITTADGLSCPWTIYPGQEVIICSTNSSLWQDEERDWVSENQSRQVQELGSNPSEH